MDDSFSDALQQILTDQCTADTVRAIEAGGPWAGLWAKLEESGFADAMRGEEHGGAGLGLSDAFPLLELCGAFALPVPLAATMLARALLDAEGIAPPAGSITLGQGARGAHNVMLCRLVPFGRVVDWVLASHDGEHMLLPVAKAAVTPAVFELDATLEWTPDDLSGAVHIAGRHDLHSLQACIHAAQLAGALMEVFRRTLQYANDRNQFGRPIGKFQAIQHQLSVISEHAFAARMAAQTGCHAAGFTPDRLRVAVAKARTSEAALEVAALSHSIHGAIGFTREFDLQLYTRRLHTWRQAAGTESYWHTVLGEQLVDHHAGLALDVIRGVTDIH